MTEVEVEQGAPAPDEPEAPPSPSARTDWVTLALDIAVWLWPLAVAAYLYNWVGHLGYNPTDDGFVLAGAQRLLHFQIPHADFVSARPVGSSSISGAASKPFCVYTTL